VSASEAAARPRQTQAERREQTEQALLDAAARRFGRSGIDNTSLAEIGEEAGYSRGLVNHRFGSKAALVERLAENSQRAFVQTVQNTGYEDEAGAVLAVIDAYLDHVTQSATATRAFIVMWGAAFPEDSLLRPIFTTDDAHFRDGIKRLVRAGQNGGCISPGVNPEGFAVIFVALLRGIAAQFYVDPAGVDITAARAAAVTFVQAALTADGPPGTRQARSGKKRPSHG
jgi:AcrR family transcriptional regulator